MVLAFDVPARSEKALEYCEFDAAEALAGHCRGADRAVVLDQQKAFARQLFEPRHVTFGRARIGERRQLLGDVGLADEPLAVGRADLLASLLEQSRQRRLAELAADRAD